MASSAGDAVRRDSSWTRWLALGALFFPPAFVLLAQLGVPYGATLPGALAAAFGVAAWLRDDAGRGPTPDARWPALLLWLALLAWLCWIQRSGAMLFNRDVLLVPGIAQGLVEAPAARDAFAVTEPGRVYPPGVPIWFSPLTLVLDGTRQLAWWTVATQAAQAAFPLLWASALLRWFRLPIDRLSLAVVLAASMLCLERSVVLGGSIKNAQFFSVGFVLPGVLLLLPRQLGMRAAGLAALLVTALVTAYYTMLQLLIALVAGWAVADVWMRGRLSPRTLRQVALLAGATCVAGLGLAWALSGVGDDPRLPDPAQGLMTRLERIVLHDRETFWFIFGFQPPHGFGAGLRRASLVLSLVVCMALPYAVRWLPGARRRLALPLASVARLALAAGVACLAIAAMVVIAPLTRLGIDFGRWLLWPLETLVLAGPFVALAITLATHGWSRSVARVLAILPIVAIGGLAHFRDAQFVRDRTTRGGVELSELRTLADRLAGSEPCLVVAPTGSILADLFQVGKYPLSDGVDLVSPCRLTGGSFVRDPLPGGRDANGLPAGPTLLAWNADQSVFALGGRDFVATLGARQPALGWLPVETFAHAGIQLWRAEPPLSPRVREDRTATHPRP